jgi:coenzyme PQQ biosynthesis protein PqqD
MVTTTDVYRRSRDSAFRIIDDEAIVVAPSEGIARVLNATAALVWQMLDGTRNLSAIIEAIVLEFDAPAQEIEADVLELVQNLKQNKMVEPGDERLQ